MAYFLCQDFSSGLDVRKSPWTSATGTLQQLDDGHITRGGEIEKRKAFDDLGDLLAATHSLASAKTGSADVPSLMVFGDAAAPVGLPAGVIYQRLQHPDGGIAMVDVVDYTLYDGKAYVVADYADGSQWHFYDGVLVTDWGAGEVRASMTTNDLIAEHLKQLIDASSSYSATRTGPNIFVTGLAGVDYTVATETVDGGGNNDQALSSNELVAASAAVTGAKAIAEFAIFMGEVGVGNYIDQVRVDAGGVFTDLLSASVPFNTTAELTALDVTNAINAGNALHGHIASTKYGKVFIGAPASLGASANGRILEVTAKGKVLLANGKFSVTGGPAAAGNEISSVSVNGAAITSAAVLWATSDSATAAAVAANINAFASSPKMNAVALGNTVYIAPEKVRSNDATSLSFAVVAIGNVSASNGASAPVEADYPDYPDPSPPGFPDRQVP